MRPPGEESAARRPDAPRASLGPVHTGLGCCWDTGQGLRVTKTLLPPVYSEDEATGYGLLAHRSQAAVPWPHEPPLEPSAEHG